MATQKVTYKEVPNNEELNSMYEPVQLQDFIVVEGTFLSAKYSNFADEILEFEGKDDDIWVVTFPKSGTTWTQEMVWCIANDLDFEIAKKIDINERFPLLEIGAIFNLEKLPKPPASVKIQLFEPNSIGYVKNLQERRFIKSHLPLALLPRHLQTDARKSKIIYVARDPRDVCVSYFHHEKLFHGFVGDFSTFIRNFLSDNVLWSPYCKHVLDFWKLRDSPSVLFLTYEEMKRYLGSVVKRVAIFLDKSLTAHQVEQLTKHLSFDSMKNNPAVNYEMVSNTLYQNTGVEGKFMRSGKVGGFKNDLTEEDIQLFDVWYKKNFMETDYLCSS